METLFSLLNEKYAQVCRAFFPKMSFVPFETLIHDGNECAEFIRAVLRDDDINQVDEQSTYYDFSKDRSTHAVLTYLVGLLFFDFKNLQSEIADMFYPNNTVNDQDIYRLWMLTSLYHDWGYTSKNIDKPNYVYKQKFDLLTDSYIGDSLSSLINYSNHYSKAFAHSYKQIMAYDRYIRKYRLEKNKQTRNITSTKPIEMIDHGILGGVTIFNRLIHNSIKAGTKSEKEFLLAKTSCITIAQHNIYKSDSTDRDKKYKKYSGGDELAYLYCNNGFSVGLGTPLLLLMSLVDTIECIKRFGKSSLASNYLQTETVLNRIEMQVTNDAFILDYSRLLKYIRKEKEPIVEEAYNDYINSSILGLVTWTDIRVLPEKTTDTPTRFVLSFAPSHFKSAALTIS